MADDIRKGDKSPTVDNTEDGSIRRPRQRGPKHDFPKTQAGKMWDALGNPDEPINTMPGGMVNTAGGRPAAVTWRDAFRFSAFSKRDLDFYRTQCARDSLLVGIGAGGGIGGLRVILKGFSSVGRSANFAAGAFVLAATGHYWWCDQRRQEEAKGMAMAVAGMKMLNDKKAREQAEAEAAAKVAEDLQKSEQKWYKFW